MLLAGVSIFPVCDFFSRGFSEKASGLEAITNFLENRENRKIPKDLLLSRLRNYFPD